MGNTNADIILTTIMTGGGEGWTDVQSSGNAGEKKCLIQWLPLYKKQNFSFKMGGEGFRFI